MLAKGLTVVAFVDTTIIICPQTFIYFVTNYFSSSVERESGREAGAKNVFLRATPLRSGFFHIPYG